MDRRVQTVLPCIREFAFWFKTVSEHAGSPGIGGETHAVVRPWSDPSILLICDIVWARRAVQPSWVGCVPADAMWQSLSPARQLEMIASMMRKTRITAKRHCNGTSVIQWFFFIPDDCNSDTCLCYYLFPVNYNRNVTNRLRQRHAEPCLSLPARIEKVNRTFIPFTFVANYQ